MTQEETETLREQVVALQAQVARLHGELAAVRSVQEERRGLTAALENILRAVPDFFFQVRRDGTVVRFLAKRTEELYVPPEVFLGKRMQDVLTPEVGALFAQAFAQVKASEGSAEVEYELETLGHPAWFEARILPLDDEHLIVVVRDVTAQRRDREALHALNAQLEARVRERTEALEVAAAERLGLQQQVIEAQRASLRALSAPLVPIARGVVAVPLIGELDAERAAQMLETLLEGVQARGAAVVLLDVTGVPHVDAEAAAAVVRVARAVGLLGAELVLTGIGPQVAQALVGMDAELSDIRTVRGLEQGIAYALRRAL
ncbi:STAS domain-containing protein [Chondromyces apiculatus]|uniref:RsbR, positive regulator of sigma-B n=1 Tax=Chondromyces apiculatus DSM 436 TaxID=1192034 RepID=A0A017TEI6_9BACT|nr:STAS domain-containing protein [Chondromyces apiculatus]EYF07703.1 RsbR, positive regulator of sigma-B [Chondromyces apiculatus DSM 436]